jgi:hypothetical protein
MTPEMTFCTSALVLNEPISLLQSQWILLGCDRLFACNRVSKGVMVMYPGAALKSDGWDLLAHWGGMGANAVDCVFDEHFRTAGFEILR